MGFGRELSSQDRRFLAETLVIVTTVSAAAISGYAVVVICFALTVYTLFILNVLDKGGMDAFDDFIDRFFFRRTAIILAIPAIAWWHIQ